MKRPIIIVAFLVIINFYSISATNDTLILPQSNVETMRELLGRKLGDLWSWIQNRGKTEDTFIGRCFGVARKLKFVMPLIIFKLGVIITTLAFLTIFALKSLGLLVLLLVINSSGFVAKLAHAKQEEKKWTPPQNVHFHIHQDKSGHYSVGHSSDPGGDHGWYDRASYVDNNEETLADRLKKLNIYDSYKR